MATIDIWQLAASFAGFAFTMGFVDQIRMKHATRNVEGLSRMQWLVFAAASGMFAAYYIHLQQWLMASLSVFGALCCLVMLAMISVYRQTTG